MLSLAIQAAIEAGNDIMSIYTDPSSDFGIERKADNSPLTRADKAAHARIVKLLEGRSTFPHKKDAIGSACGLSTRSTAPRSLSSATESSLSTSHSWKTAHR